MARRAILARHHVQRQVDKIDDLSVRLADAGGLDNDEIEPGRLIQPDHILQDGGGGEILPPGRQRAHENRLGGEAVHADAIAQKRPAAAPPGRIHRHDGNLQVRERAHQACEQLISEAGLSRSTGTGNADDGGLVPGPRQNATDLFPGGRGLLRSLEHRNRPGDGAVVARIQRPELVLRFRRGAQAGEDVVDHAVQAHPAAVLGGIDLLHPVALQSLDLLRRNGAPTADHHPDMLIAALAEHIHHIGEVLVMPALVGAYGDGVRILLDGGAHNIRDAPVVAEMDHFRAVRLEEAPDHVDGGIVPVEE